VALFIDMFKERVQDPRRFDIPIVLVADEAAIAVLHRHWHSADWRKTCTVLTWTQATMPPNTRPNFKVLDTPCLGIECTFLGHRTARLWMSTSCASKKIFEPAIDLFDVSAVDVSGKVRPRAGCFA
jgi:hypothetical protein